ncbi:hypothetical protein [Vibrio nigripulchritudo]|uniref:hypothetical protein n=1 Tax=Vibrio nigripulchritudo TaxID=28173 RepID=UPI0003B1D2C5|nr:hypothetical protein [Vibrio nigripulchritudo]CCN72628.1 conserved hypothetical protein [Vibrio nigripulchritudo SFn118]
MKKLKFPNSDVDFVITPAFFLGDFDIYDREESLGEYLERFDPNDSKQLRIVLEEKLINGGRFNMLSTMHKYVILNELAIALSDKKYDFSEFFTSHDQHFSLPWTWNIDNPRNFFEVVYEKIYDAWNVEISSSGLLTRHPDEITGLDFN